MATNIKYTTSELRDKVVGALPDNIVSNNSTSKLRDKYESSRAPEPLVQEDNGSTRALRDQIGSMRKGGAVVGWALGKAVDYAVDAVDTLNNKLNDWTDGWVDLGQMTVSPLNKLWRLKIMGNRKSWPGEKASGNTLVGNLFGQKDPSDFNNLHYTTTKPNYNPSSPPALWNGAKAGRIETSELELPSNEIDQKLKEYELKLNGSTEPYNRIHSPKKSFSVVSIDEAMAAYRSYSNSLTSKPRIIIANYNNIKDDYVVLQTVPKIQSSPTGNWVAVNSMGRNDPWAMYTGGEEKVTMEISWYSMDPSNRADVLEKVLHLVSWSRADGYRSSPPVLKIIWGAQASTNSNMGTVFAKGLFVLESAQYTLDHFNDKISTSRRSGGASRYSLESLIELGLMPSTATQTLVFRRVSKTNRTWSDIRFEFETPVLPS